MRVDKTKCLDKEEASEGMLQVLGNVLCSNSFFTKYFLIQELEIKTKKETRLLKVHLGSLNHPSIGTQRHICWGYIVFIFTRILIGKRELDFAVIGTARERRGFPSKEITNMSGNRFNTLHCINGKNFQIQKWIDNNVVTIIMIPHTPHETFTRNRKNPRVY